MVKYFKVTVLTDNNIKSWGIASSTYKTAKACVETYLRSNNMFNSRVVNVTEIDYDTWLKLTS